MSDITLKGFLKTDVQKAEDIVFYRVSDRFSVDFQLKSISTELNEELKKRCTTKVGGARGTPGFDVNQYNTLLVINSITYPCLTSKELQDSWGVMGEEALIKAMVSKPGEFSNLTLKVMEVNGFTTMDEDIETAKNS